MIGYYNCFNNNNNNNNDNNNNQTMCFKCNDKKLLKNYNKVSEKNQ